MNPLDYIGKEFKSVQTLKQELKDIYDGWILEMKAMIQEPAVKKNILLVSPDDKQFLENFIIDFELIDNHLNATRLISLLSQLYEGFSTIELSLSDLPGIFKRALTVEEAKEAFTKYIDKCCSGEDPSKVRIILK